MSVLQKKTAVNNTNDEIIKQIKDLKELYDSEVITKEEFEKAKKKVLN